MGYRECSAARLTPVPGFGCPGPGLRMPSSSSAACSSGMSQSTCRNCSLSWLLLVRPRHVRASRSRAIELAPPTPPLPPPLPRESGAVEQVHDRGREGSSGYGAHPAGGSGSHGRRSAAWTAPSARPPPPRRIPGGRDNHRERLRCLRHRPRASRPGQLLGLEVLPHRGVVGARLPPRAVLLGMRRAEHGLRGPPPRRQKLPILHALHGTSPTRWQEGQEGSEVHTGGSRGDRCT